MITRHPNDTISRRRFLRGLGIAMSLPWLESLNSWGAAAAGVSGASGAPRRLAVCFMGNGVNPFHWGAENTPQGMQLLKSLSPLESLKDKLLVFKGLWNPTTVAGPGGHYPKMNLLSGLTVKQTTTDVQVGTTMDQLVAAETGKHTPMPSIVLGTEGPSYSTDAGYTSIYSAYISWSSPTSPAPKEIYPQQAFDQLFDDGSQRKRDKSVLDLVNDDAKALRTRLSKHDVHKLDEYLTSVRELEQRIERADEFSKANTAGAGWQPTVKAPTFPRPAAGIPAKANEHLRTMFDIMVLAFQMDRTRVATFMLNNDLTNMNFGIEGVKGGVHELSHHANDPKRLEQYQLVNQHHMELWAEALQKMAATNEGERSLLDNSMAMFTSSLFDGNAHDSRQLPVLLAGGGGGTIKGGRMLDYSKEENRKLCRLHMALMDRMGCKTDHFGDADKALTDLA
ncbi:protein of unknown function DUF1552 [Chthoniobacter flavus Ellin428]|uniref:Secreted protein containing DUF1552 n=1 Tax=Chthoniobacter flavus Ellin428 TaxID=497964 RepID=B4DB31_9BACT|nr:DUF1552 domain-containing protein [Chthoniobacter flavus]EDY16309.1 protein of unknown function DUF1552 [Chthoniobacter flavus Ellin428]TCO90272.1 uncharacterized protein DUF1552 [Chthoniobacter flavus]